MLSVLSACARLAWADWRASRALVGSIFASSWPTLTCFPTAASSAVSVPVVPKLALAAVATLTLPEALTLDWMIPRETVAVRWTPVAADELPRKPYIELSPKKIATAAAATRTA